MPKPLAHYLGDKGRYQIQYGPTLHRNHQLAAQVMAVIETWSFNEMTIMRMAANFLHVDVATVTEMLHCIESTNARRAAIRGAAKFRLSDEDHLLFEAVLATTKASEKRRDEFAHRIWGTCPECPECLLLIEPKALLSQEAETTEMFRAQGANLPSAITFDNMEPLSDSVMVYTAADIQAEVTSAFRANNVLSKLRSVLEPRRQDAPTQILDTMRASLEADPLIAQKMANLKARQVQQAQQLPTPQGS